MKTFKEILVSLCESIKTDQDFIDKAIELGAKEYDSIPNDKFKKLSDDDLMKIIIVSANKQDNSLKNYWLKRKSDKKFIDFVKNNIKK